MARKPLGSAWSTSPCLEVSFSHTPIPFTLEDIVAHDASLPRANSLASMSLASTLLDRRIPEMTIKVYRVRRLCQDALVGIAHVPISTTELAGTSRDHSIYLENGCGSALGSILTTP